MKLKAKVVLEFEYELDMENWEEQSPSDEEHILACEVEELRENPSDMLDAWTEHDGKISVEVVPAKRKRD